MSVQKKRITELPLTNNLTGLVTLGVDSNNEGVKIPIGSLLEEAKQSGQAATTVANEAKTAAQTAKSIAQAASTLAQTAKNAADGATTVAGNAKTQAETAKGNAETAITKATTALTNANNAQTTANSALDLANEAKIEAQQAGFPVSRPINNLPMNANNLTESGMHIGVTVNAPDERTALLLVIGGKGATTDTPDMVFQFAFVDDEVFHRTGTRPNDVWSFSDWVSISESAGDTGLHEFLIDDTDGDSFPEETFFHLDRHPFENGEPELESLLENGRWTGDIHVGSHSLDFTQRVSFVVTKNSSGSVTGAIANFPFVIRDKAYIGSIKFSGFNGTSFTTETIDIADLKNDVLQIELDPAAESWNEGGREFNIYENIITTNPEVYRELKEKGRWTGTAFFADGEFYFFAPLSLYDYDGLMNEIYGDCIFYYDGRPRRGRLYFDGQDGNYTEKTFTVYDLVEAGQGLGYDNGGRLTVRASRGLKFDSLGNLEASPGDGLRLRDELEVKPGGGIKIDDNGAVAVNPGLGLKVDSTSGAVSVKTGAGLITDLNMNLKVNLGTGLKIENNEVTLDTVTEATIDGDAFMTEEEARQLVAEILK